MLFDIFVICDTSWVAIFLLEQFYHTMSTIISSYEIYKLEKYQSMCSIGIEYILITALK